MTRDRNVEIEFLLQTKIPHFNIHLLLLLGAKMIQNDNQSVKIMIHCNSAHVIITHFYRYYAKHVDKIIISLKKFGDE